MFVVEHEKIKGVVHIVDYNNDLINFEFYKAVYHFEKMLRGVLHFRGETNDSLLEWMKKKGKYDNHWRSRYRKCNPKDHVNNQKKEEQRRNCGPFQTFYLNDLLYFVSDREYVSRSFRESIDGIRNLRNWVAHSQDLAYKTGEVDAPLYRIDELKQFVRNANRFFECFEELEDLVRRDDIPLDFLRNH